jgi:hypothetical protein
VIPSPERASLARSLEIVHEYQWMLLRHLYIAVHQRFAERGLECLRRGLRSFGQYRGQAIADHPETIATGRTTSSLVRQWDLPDFVLAAERGDVRIEVGGASAEVRLPSVPGGEYFRAKGCWAALELYWASVLDGLAVGYDHTAEVAASPTDATPWSMTWQVGQRLAPDDRHTVALDDTLADRAKYLRMARRTTGITAALEMFVGKALLDHFDASGEEALREACFNYGAERGREMRELHLAAGIPLNLESLVGKLAEERDPLRAIFVGRGESYVAPGLQRFDCTYCPLAEVWAEQGQDGLALGYIFDMELHRGLLETYYPGAIVKWDLLKTRGDAICRFRFSIPDLMTDADHAANAS